jgi:hypothetical protein
VLEPGDRGIREAGWDDPEIIHSRPGFLNDPAQHLRYLLADDEDGRPTGRRASSYQF